MSAATTSPIAGLEVTLGERLKADSPSSAATGSSPLSPAQLIQEHGLREAGREIRLHHQFQVLHLPGDGDGPLEQGSGDERLASTHPCGVADLLDAR